MIDDPCNVSRLEDSYEYFADGLLVVEGGKIKHCGAASEVLLQCGSDLEMVDCSKHLIFPGMVDCHVHFPQMDMIGSYGEQLLDWLTRYTFPAEERFSDPAYCAKVARLFTEELLRAGTTTAMVFCTVHRASAEALFREASRRNMLIIAGKVMMDREPYAPPGLRAPAEQSYLESKALIDEWHGHKRCLYAVTPRFAITSTMEELELAGKLVAEHEGVYVQTHVNENLAEIELAKELFQSDSYLAIYDRAGLLGPRCVLGHCVHMTDKEWDRMAETRSVVAFCPTSNLFLGSGLMDIKAATARGVRIGLGSDIGAGTSLSQLQTLNEAYKVAQLQGLSLHPLRQVYMATLGGARALSLGERIGSFAPGKDADFVLLDEASTPMLSYRRGLCGSLLERLFLLTTLADDRAVAATYVAGRCQHRRL